MGTRTGVVLVLCRRVSSSFLGGGLGGCCFRGCGSFLLGSLGSFLGGGLGGCCFRHCGSFLLAVLIRRWRFRAPRVRCWSVTAGGNSGTTGGSGESLLVLAREWVPSEVDQWELVEREPHFEVWLPLGLEPPNRKCGEARWICRGWSRPHRKCGEARWNCWCLGWWWYQLCIGSGGEDRFCIGSGGEDAGKLLECGNLAVARWREWRSSEWMLQSCGGVSSGGDYKVGGGR
jgi:hypothetical protein